MPTSRKRIGFLPTAEVQGIIDKISAESNLSQSKVTGILVEEALKARNLYKANDVRELKEKDLNYECNQSKIYNSAESVNNKNNLAEDKEYLLIKEYLNFKNFKKILSIVQTES